MKSSSVEQKVERPVMVEIPAPEIRTMKVWIEGDTSLICHNFSAANKKKMRDKQTGTPVQRRAPKDPNKEFKESLYPMPDGHGFGIKAGAFKEAAIFTCSHISGITKVQAKGAFFILGDLVLIVDPKTKKPAEPIMREDNVRIGRGTTDLRYRGEFLTWACELTIRYNSLVMNAEQIINLLNTAGFASGVGEWRPSSPQKSGPHGMFHVAGGSK